MEKAPKTTGKRIEELIKQKGIMKKVLAAEMEVSPVVISNWIANKYNPDSKKMNKLAEYFNVDIEYLLCEQDYKNLHDSMGIMKDVSFNREQAIKRLLLAYGYEIKEKKAIWSDGAYYKPNKEFSDLSIYDNIYEIINRDGEKKLISENALNDLIDSLFVLLDHKLFNQTVLGYLSE